MKAKDDFYEEPWTGDCADCDGTGRTECDLCEGDGEYNSKICPRCNGEGDIPCPCCNGTGIATYHMGQRV